MADQSFDVDKYITDNTQGSDVTNKGSSFDVDKYIADANKSTPEQPSTLANYGTMAARGLTAGLTGAAAGIGGALGTAAGGKPDLESIIAAYKEAMQGQKDKEKAAADETGLSGKAVEFASSIPTMMVGGSALKGAGLVSPIANAAGLGAGTGLASYVGQTVDPSLAGAATATGLGAGLGAAGGAIGQKIGSMLNPEGLESSASKMAQEAMGMNSSKDLTSRYNTMTGQSERGSDIIKGTGTTALNQGILKGGQSSWYDNALAALKTNSSKLSPLLDSTQQKLDQNLPNIIDNVGPITTKTPDVMQDIFDSIPQTSQRNSIVRKITQQYQNYEQKLSQADGNLQDLNAVKQELQTAAQSISPQIYTNGSSKAEADLYNRLGGVVRQHIEDLASAVDPGTGDAIHTINKDTGNIISMLPSLQKTTRGGIPTSWGEVAQKVIGPVEGYAAKGMSALTDPSVRDFGQQSVNTLTSNPEIQQYMQSKAIQTPAGDLVQKAAPPTPVGIVTNPFTQERVQGNTKRPNDFTNTSLGGTSQAQKIATNLYTATDESLKEVANNLSKDPMTQFYGDHLNRAIDANDNGEKNRAIFLIMQNPASRRLIQPIKEK